LVHILPSPDQQQLSSTSVAEWLTSEAYLASAQNIKAVNVVNDAAE